MPAICEKEANKTLEKSIEAAVFAVSEFCLEQVTPSETIEFVASRWPENLEVSVLEMRSAISKALSELGWGDCVGERRWYGWIDLLKPIVPTDRTPTTVEFEGVAYRENLRLDGTAFRELLYQGYFRYSCKRNSTAQYLSNRKKRLGA